MASVVVQTCVTKTRSHKNILCQSAFNIYTYITHILHIYFTGVNAQELSIGREQYEQDYAQYGTFYKYKIEVRARIGDGPEVHHTSNKYRWQTK